MSSPLPTSTPIVGAHFRPPAKQVCQLLPLGQTLLLQREPDNQYDPFAVKVLVDLTEMPDSFWDELKPHLQGAGVEMDEVEVDDYHIGFVDSKKTGNAKLVSEAILAGHEPTATLSRDMKGDPIALIDWVEAEPEEEDELSDPDEEPKD